MSDIQIRVFRTKSQATDARDKSVAQGLSIVVQPHNCDSINWINKADGDASAVALDNSDTDGVWLLVVEQA